MRLYYTGISIQEGKEARYNFIFDGKSISLPSREARDLISSIPKDERDCKVAFNQVTLKSVVRHGKNTTVMAKNVMT